MAQNNVVAALGTVPDHVSRDLVCPRCGSERLECSHQGGLLCAECGNAYPVVNNIPVLIDEQRSVFSIADFTSQRSLFFDLSSAGRLRRLAGKILPNLDKNPVSPRNYARLARLLGARGARARVLILGGSVEGYGIGELLRSPHVDLVESDVSFGPRTQIILDAHTIPYKDGAFDCVIAQAVLEHVLDPHACVREIARVLKSDGLIYVETPFMQQVHGGAYDFTRFSHSGHRSLLRDFAEIDSGMTSGPGAVMAWSYQYLLLSLFGYSDRARFVIKAFARLTGFWLRYLDHLAARNPRSSDAASGLYFLGRKAAAPLTGREIIAYYRQRPGRQ